MKIKVLAFTLLIGLALCIPAYAQRNAGAGKQKRAGLQQRNGQGMGMRDGKAAFQELGLTNEQKQKIQKVMQEYRTSMADVMKSSDNAKDKAAKVKKARNAAMTSIKAILTVEQFEKAQKAKLFDGMFGAGNVGMKFMRLLQQLNLTDSQKSDLKAILENQAKQTKAIREDSSLTPAQKMEKIRPIRKAGEEKIMKLLTTDQKAKLKELMKKQPRRHKPAGAL